jgi:hypothetical protein
MTFSTISILRRSGFTFWIFVLAVSAMAKVGGTSTGPAACPHFEVKPSVDRIDRGGTVEFYIVSENPDILNGKFEWRVNRGVIVSGQGTLRIKVEDKFPLASSAAGAGADAKLPPGFVRSELPMSWMTSGDFVGLRSSIHATVTVRSDSPHFSSCIGQSRFVRIGREQIVNQPANITGLTVDQTKLVAPCRPGTHPREGVEVSESMVLDVTTTAFDAENDVVTYDYTVSGGRVVGTGPKVQWDLTGVEPGIYTITAGVDDGCGICGRTRTEQITVVECEALSNDVECPTIEINGPADKRRSESVFTARISGGSQQYITYLWSVTNGEILTGQGTPSITIRPPQNATGSVTVKIGGLDPLAACIDLATKNLKTDV